MPRTGIQIAADEEFPPVRVVGVHGPEADRKVWVRMSLLRFSFNPIKERKQVRGNDTAKYQESGRFGDSAGSSLSHGGCRCGCCQCG